MLIESCDSVEVEVDGIGVFFFLVRGTRRMLLRDEHVCGCASKTRCFGKLFDLMIKNP